MEDVKVGDMVAWANVPDGAMVQHRDGDGDTYTEVRANGRGWCVNVTDDPDDWDYPAMGGLAAPDRVTVVAMGLTGQESAADLQRLAEVFEVREAWLAMPPFEIARIASLVVAYADAGAVGAFDDFYRRLHAAGWRPGMTAEDAARMLAEVRDAG